MAPLERSRAENPHTGTIITERPNKVWASDHTATATVEDGQVTGSWRSITARRNAWASRGQESHAVRGPGAAPAGGARLLRRIPPGAAPAFATGTTTAAQYLSDDYQAEIALPGHAISLHSWRQPQCMAAWSGHPYAERALLWVRTFQNVKSCGMAWRNLRERYNKRWIVQRLGYLRPPSSPAASCTWGGMNTLSSVSRNPVLNIHNYWTKWLLYRPTESFERTACDTGYVERPSC